jgi:hypothetical protein
LTYISLSYVLGSGISSALISYRGGQFSHVDSIMPSGLLLGARSDAIGGAPPGVQQRADNYEKWAARAIVNIPCSSAQSDAYYEFVLSQCGKPYDKIAILDFALGRHDSRDWRNPSAWFCDELVVAGFEVCALLQRLFVIPANRIDPGGSFLIASALGGQVVSSYGL